MSIVVLGANGQVGRALLQRVDARAVGRPDVDYTRLETVLSTSQGRTW